MVRSIEAPYNLGTVRVNDYYAVSIIYMHVNCAVTYEKAAHITYRGAELRAPYMCPGWVECPG